MKNVIATSGILLDSQFIDGVWTKVTSSQRQQYQIEKPGKKRLEQERNGFCQEMSLRFPRVAGGTRQVSSQTRYGRK